MIVGTCMRKYVRMNSIHWMARVLISQCRGMFEELVEYVFNENHSYQKIVLDYKSYHHEGFDYSGKHHEKSGNSWKLKNKNNNPRL